MNRFCTVAAALALAALGLAPLTGHAQYDRPIDQPLGQAPWGGPAYGGAPVGGYGGAPVGGYGAPAGGYGGGYGGQAVVCESRDGAFAECRTPFSGPPAIARTLSSSACVQGQTWGSRGAGSVWVMAGCRAEFVDAYGAQPGMPPAYGQADGYAVRCESDEGRQRECRANVATRLTLVRQLSESPCVEGQSWGSDNRGRVWVRYGCRGDFAPAQGWGQGAVPGVPSGYGYSDGNAIRCESDNGRQRECRANVATRLTLVRQLSESACVEGQSWGSDNRGRVWVRYGCRGEFAPAQGWSGAQTGGAYGYGGSGVVCESVERRYNACAWDPRWGRPYLAEQMSSDACQEGRSWGFDGRGQIWVDRGCRGRFAGR